MEIDAKTLYRNVHATCRWLSTNVFLIRHMTSFYNKVFHIVHVLMTKNQQFCMCYQLFSTICNVKDRESKNKDRESKKHKVIFPFPILIAQIYKSWMLEDEYNEIYRDRIMIASESKTVPYFASLQIDWTEETTHADIHVVPSESFEEDDDDQLFEQESPHDNGELW